MAKGFRVNATEPLVLIITGLSGAGKDSVISKMKELGGVDFRFVVTCNTRAKRENEVNGVDYHFVSRERFLEMVANDEMLEHSQVYDDYKGVPRFEVENAYREGKDLLMRVDIQGVKKLKKVLPNAVSVFIIPPDSESWLKRLRARNTESEDSLQLRIDTAETEIENIPFFDYVVINDNLEKAAIELTEIVHAEHCRSFRRKVEIHE